MCSLKFDKIINACGQMSVLGVSRISPTVGQAMVEAGQQFYVMETFKQTINHQIGKLINSLNVLVVNSASAGIVLGVKGVIADHQPSLLSTNPISKNQIIICKAHNIDYGVGIDQMIKLGSGVVVEAGHVNKCSPDDVVAQINQQTAGLMYVVSHHTATKNVLSLAQMLSLGKTYHLPVIIDAAAETDIFSYARLDADLVIFSGSKALGGPTSGLLFGTNTQLFNQINQAMQTIGRCMKIGKENIMGLYQAICEYQPPKPIDHQPFFDEFSTNQYIIVKLICDARQIVRIGLMIKPNYTMSASELSTSLKQFFPSIWLRDYQANTGLLEIDLRNITLAEGKIINQAISEIFRKKGYHDK